MTGAYLSGRRAIAHRSARRPIDGDAILVRGARAQNLRGVDVRFPLRALSVVTGVSGSGKSTLVDEVLHRNLARARGERVDAPGACDAVEGAEELAEIVFVDAAPLGRSPKSIVATVCGAYERIRQTLASLPEARERRLTASTFSFNARGGRCEACEGAGFERVEMQFLADLFLPCSECGGDRFRPEVRRVHLRGRTIGEILDLTVDDAVGFFEDDDPEIRRRFEPLRSVGLGYLRIGQSVTALSGGEAQRLKLATAIAGESSKAGSLFLFDEPTTGLHLEDVARLLETLDRLVEAGHTVVAIEHQLDFVAHADWVVDLGPEAGPDGGAIVVCGPPEVVAACSASVTGRYLREAGVEPARDARPTAAVPRGDSHERSKRRRLRL
ncbi:MAG TPA: hypothetical protein VKE69_01735 [Planctomycetota bacterium]|nr:hypothetical protein [Planctomycetota bacterium]